MTQFQENPQKAEGAKIFEDFVGDLRQKSKKYKKAQKFSQQCVRILSFLKSSSRADM